MDLLIDGVPKKGFLLLAHGAGMPMDHPFMNEFCLNAGALGLEVVRFEFPYMQGRRKTGKRALPNKMDVLTDCFEDVFRRVEARNSTAKLPVFIAGKSLGGRVATLVADKLKVNAVFVIGYPFHPVKKPEKLRTEHLQKIVTPVHIFQGDRDPFGTREEVEGYSLSASVNLYWLEDGDHDLKPRKKSGCTQQQHLRSVLQRISELIE